MNRHCPRLTLVAALSSVGRRLLVLSVAFFLLLAGRSPALAARSEDPPAADWRLVGDWSSFANGEDLRALALGPSELWSGSQGGGILRWRRDGQVIRQYLAPQDGLPCNKIRDLIRWRERWFAATCGGLAVYDPSRDRFSVVDAGVSSPSLTALAIDDRDRLWVAGEQVWDPQVTVDGVETPGAWVGGGVAYTPDLTQWSAFRQASGLPSDNIRDLAFWKGAMWLASEPYRRWQPGQTDAGGDKEPGRWVWAGGGVAVRTVSGWTRHDSASDSGLSDSVRHLVAGREALWAGTWGRGLAAYDGARWTQYRDCGNSQRCIQSDYVSALAIGPDDALWMGTATFNGQGRGVNVLDARGTPAKADDDAWFLLRTTDGLPSDLINAILPDDDAGVWFGAARLGGDGQTSGLGLTRLLGDRQTVRVFRAPPAAGASLPENEVTALAQDPVGEELWVGTARGGIAVRDRSGLWRHYTRASTGGGLGSDSIADIVIEAGGIVWVATRQTQYDSKLNRWTDGGLSRFDGQIWTRLSTSDGLPGNHLSALALDGRGKLWVGTGATDRGPKELTYRGAGLAVLNLQDRKVERKYTFGDLTSDNITDLTVVEGKVYAATAYFYYIDNRPGGARLNLGGGLNIFDLAAGTWRRIGSAEGLTPAVKEGGTQTRPLIDLRSVVVQPGGRVWLGGMAYANGIFDPDRRPDGIVEEVSPDGQVTHHRFASADAVRALALDGAARLWAGTAHDGVRILADGSWHAERAHAGGLPSEQMAALLIVGDRVWFGSASEGLFLLAPPKPPEPEQPGTGPSGTDRLFRRMPYAIFLPRVPSAQEPRFVILP